MTRSTTTRRENHAPLDLDVIRAKSIEEGECWVWGGALHCGAPVAKHGSKTVNVRRYIAAQLQGLAVDGKLASTRCRNPTCCAPHHIELLTRLQMQRRTTKATRHQQRTTRREKIALAARARSPLDAGAIAQIRASDRTGRELAAEHGVTLKTVQRIRNHQSWRDYRSPFAGLQP